MLNVEQSDFILSGRELTDEEQHILYCTEGAHDNMSFFKVDSFLCIVKLLESVFAGNTVTLPIAPKNNCMYLFYDLPAGTKYFLYDLLSYGNTPRNQIGDMSLYEIKYLLNSFFIPKILAGCSMIDPNITNNTEDIIARTIYSAVNIDYELLADIISAGLLVMTDGTKVISVCSGRSKSLLTTHIANNCQKLQVERSILTQEEQREQDLWVMYGLPSDAQHRCTVESVKPADSYTADLILSPSIFSWMKETYIVISNKYIRLNGFVLNDGIPQLAITNAASFYDKSGSSLIAAVATLSGHIERLICSQASTSFSAATNMFNAGSISGLIFSWSYKNSIVSLNKETMEVMYKYYLRSVLYSEHISLNNGILGDMHSAFLSASDTSNYTKTEFKQKIEPCATEKELNSPRYDTIKTSDHKLMFLSKTSKTKEGLKQARISRTITDACSSVVTYAVELFAASDLVHPGNRAAAISTYSRSMTGFITTKLSNFDAEVLEHFYTQVNNFNCELLAMTSSLAKTYMNSLYTNFDSCNMLTSLNGYPSMDSAVTDYSWRAQSFSSYDKIDQKKYVFGKLFKGTALAFNTSVFSPSSSALDLPILARHMYINAAFGNMPATLVANITSASGQITGTQFHYFYTNNFISLSDTMDKLVEDNKQNTYFPYTPYTERSTPISSCFTWSQPAADAWAAIKKCKTFTDYFNWYKSIYVSLQNIVDTVVKPDDEIGAYILSQLAVSYLTVLEGLSVAETPYLPAKKPSKKKTAVNVPKAIATEEISDTSCNNDDETCEEHDDNNSNANNQILC